MGFSSYFGLNRFRLEISKAVNQLSPKHRKSVIHSIVYSHSSPPACLCLELSLQHRQIVEQLILYFSAASLNVLNISPVVIHLIFLLLWRTVFLNLQLLQLLPRNKFPGYACQVLPHSLHCTNMGLFLLTQVPITLIAGNSFAISSTKSSWVLRALLAHFGQPVLLYFATR